LRPSCRSSPVLHPSPHTPEQTRAVHTSYPSSVIADEWYWQEPQGGINLRSFKSGPPYTVDRKTMTLIISWTFSSISLQHLSVQPQRAQKGQ
jgi:hypothetical protein